MTGISARQTEDDSAAGVTVANRRLRRDGVGPLVSCRYGRWTFTGYYIRDVDWQNIFGGTGVWLRVTYHP